MKILLLNLIGLLATIEIANAYIGPGMAGGFLIATVGIIVGLISLVIGILYFPIKRIFKSKTNRKNTNKPKQ